MGYKGYKRELKLSKVLNKPISNNYIALNSYINFISTDLKIKKLHNTISCDNDVFKFCRIYDYTFENIIYVYYNNKISFVKYGIPLEEMSDIIKDILQPIIPIDLNKNKVIFMQYDLVNL